MYPEETYLFYSELAGCFDNIVCGPNVPAVALVVWDQHISGVGGKMNDYIGGTGHVRTFVAGEVEVCRQRIETLPAVGEVRLEGEDTGGWVREVDQVEV